MKTHVDTLRRVGACNEAVKWVRERKGTAQAIWSRCRRADWMLWYAGRCSRARGSPAHRAVVLAACACARTALRYVPAGETRSLAAIELAERWARGDDSITAEQLRTTAYDAADAADASVSAASAAADAAYAATSAAAVAADATSDAVAYAAAAAAAYAAYADAAYAAYADDAYADAARTKALARMAKIVRKFIPKCPRRKP